MTLNLFPCCFLMSGPDPNRLTFRKKKSFVKNEHRRVKQMKGSYESGQLSDGQRNAIRPVTSVRWLGI